MALQDLPTPRSQPQILGEMLDGITSRIGIRRLKVGNPILSILEAVSLSTAKSTADAFRTLQSKDIDNTTGIALQRTGNDEKIPQLGPLAATTNVTITDTSFVRISSNIYHGTPAPIVGSDTVNVDKSSTFVTAASSGNIYIGRGTPRSEGPIPYSSITDGGNYWIINLTTATTSFHNQGEDVVVGQGGDRTVDVGQSVSTPAGALSNPIQYTVIVGGVLSDGEVELDDVLVRCTISGTQGNVPENTITSFNGTAPFNGAAVTNPNRVTSGRDAETTQQYRDRIKTTRNTKPRGTDLAIKTSVLNLTAPDEQKTVLSSSIERRYQKPSILYIDDGNGYEPISSGVGYEVLRDSASGGEVDFKTINAPIVIASVETLNSGPYAITAGLDLTIAAGNDTETHIFDTTLFNDSSVATPYDVVDSINSNPLLSFKARVTSNSSKVTVYSKDDTADNIQVIGGSANEILGFPTQKAYRSLLYKDDKLLTFDNYSLDRATGSITLNTALAAGEKLTLGSLWSRGFIESAAISTFNLSSDQKLWFVLDGDTTIVDSGKGEVSTLTVSIVKSLPSSFHIAIQNSSGFSSNTQAGNSILLYATSDNGIPSALQGVWKIIEVPAIDTIVIELPCMIAARKMAASANIASGRVLICGGLCANGSGILKTADIYNSSTGQWTSAPYMAFPRYGHTATTLANGKVFVYGGIGTNGVAVNTAEVYDPTANTWTSVASYGTVTGQAFHSAVLLGSGNVLVAGGYDAYVPPSTLNISVEYNPTSNTWGNPSTFNNGRHSLTLVSLPNNKVMMIGGLQAFNDPYLEDIDTGANVGKFLGALTTYMYDASAHSWSSTASLTDANTRTAYRNYVGAKVASDKVVAVADNQYYLYTISTNTWVLNGKISTSAGLSSNEDIYNGTSSLNQTQIESDLAYSTLGRSNPLLVTANGTVAMCFAEYTNTTTNSKAFAHLKFSTSDSNWHVVPSTGSITLSGGKSFWTGVASQANADSVLIFGGQQGADGTAKLASSYLQESAITSTIETVNTNTGATSYLSPVTGIYSGNQGWVIYNTTKPTFENTVPANNYSATTLAANINISGLSASSFNNSILRVRTNDNAGDIVLLGPTVQNIQSEVLQTSSPNTRASVATNNTELSNPVDFRLYQIGEILGPVLRVPCQQIAGTAADPQITGGYLPLHGTLCGLYKKNYWEDSLTSPPYNWPTLIQDSSNDGRELGNLKNEIGRLSVSIKENQFAFDANNTIPDSSVVATDGTTTITPNQAIYCGSPFLFSPGEKLSVTIDNDSTSGMFNIPTSRKLKPYDNSYASLITVTDAENGNASLKDMFGSSYDFSNFYVSMRARNKLGNILYRFYRPGPEGENYVVRYEYPSAANASIAVTVDHTWKHTGTNATGHLQKSLINVTLPSSTPYTGAVINPTSKIAILERNLNLGLTNNNRLADLYLVLGFTVTQAERTSIGGTTRLRIGYPSTTLTDFVFIQAGDFIRFDAVTPTPTTLLSGQAQVSSVSAPVSNYQDIYITAGSLDDGTSAMSLVNNPGWISLDPAATSRIQFDSGITNGDLVSINIPASQVDPTYAPLLGQGFPVIGNDSTKQWLQLRVRASDTDDFQYYSTLTDTTSIATFKSSSITEDLIVSAVNALTNAPIIATLIGVPASVGSASWNSSNYWDAGVALTDGYNKVYTTVQPSGLNNNYQLNLMRSINTNLTSNSDWINEQVYLSPAYARDVVKWFNTPCITGLWTLADVETCNSSTGVQIMSKTVGNTSSVQVSGAGANQCEASIVGAASLITGDTPTTYPNFIVNINTANAAGFIGNSMVKIANETATQKQYINISSIVTQISKDGTISFSGQVPYSCGTHITTTGSIEKAGNFVVIRLATAPSVPPYAEKNTISPGDYIYLSSPKYEDEPLTSLLGDISKLNVGVFRIINVSHNNTVIWIENSDAVTEKAVLNATFVTSDSVVPGDIITLIDNGFGQANKGSWKVTSVGTRVDGEQFVLNTINVDISNKSISSIASPQLFNYSTALVSDGAPRTFYKKLIGVNPNASNVNLTELVLCSNICPNQAISPKELSYISESAGSVISSMNKLDFPTETQVGNAAYRYNTGLIGEAQKVIYGVESDPVTYPGWVSNGASVLIDGPAIKRIQLGFYVRAVGNPDSSLADKITSVIAGVINSNPAGQNLSISDLITAGGGVDNVVSITCLSQVDQIPVMASEKTMVLNLNDISIVFVN